MTSSDWLFIALIIAFIAMFVAIFVLNGLETKWKRPGWLVTAALAVGLVSAIYVASAGVMLLDGWHDPVSSLDPERTGSLAARGRGGVGVILLVIRLWPYVLIGLGGIFTYLYSRLLHQSAKGELL